MHINFKYQLSYVVRVKISLYEYCTATNRKRSGWLGGFGPAGDAAVWGGLGKRQENVSREEAGEYGLRHSSNSCSNFSIIIDFLQSNSPSLKSNPLKDELSLSSL